jgi:hypothetical protein
MRIRNFDKVSKMEIVDKIITCFTTMLLLFGLLYFKKVLIGYLIATCAFFSYSIICELDFERDTAEFIIKNGEMCGEQIFMYFMAVAIMKFFVFLIVLTFVGYPC